MSEFDDRYMVLDSPSLVGGRPDKLWSKKANLKSVNLSSLTITPSFLPFLLSTLLCPLARGLLNQNSVVLAMWSTWLTLSFDRATYRLFETLTIKGMKRPFL